MTRQTTRQKTPHPVVQLRSKRLSFHPWVMKGQVRSWDADVEFGRPASFVDDGGFFVGSGLFHPRSRVQGRILCLDPRRALDEVWLEEAIRRAASLRTRLGIDSKTDAYRLVNSEGDGLSGLIVDRYADVMVVQLRTVGFFHWRKALAGILDRIVPGCEVIFITEATAARTEGFSLAEQSAEPRVITEDGVRFGVDFSKGHKTGFFLDQRENRRRVAELVGGRSLLDLCCYTGGFALTAAVHGAPSSVTGVDLDEKAIARAELNAKENGVEARWLHTDCFAFLKESRREKQLFDAIVLDPPKLARRKSDLPKCEQTLIDMNRHAMRVAASDALFVTSSCSGLLSRERFVDLVRKASRRANRELQIFSAGGPAADHPRIADFPEGDYLHVLFAVVRGDPGVS